MPSSPETECDVCAGDGFYPIFDRYGAQRYSIRCPECFGSVKGEVDSKVGVKEAD